MEQQNLGSNGTGSSPVASDEPRKPAAQVAPSPAAIVKATDEPAGVISAFSSGQNFESAQRMAKALAASTLMPDAYRSNIPNTLIALELASRIGASVLMVAQNLHIIHGRPGWSATFLIACVNQSGRFSPLRYRWQGDSGTKSWGCRAYAFDKETGEECTGALVTIALADSEGWTKKSGSKWLTMPEQMLMYRAAAFWTRVYAPELTLGMQSAEEIVDTTGTAVDVVATPAALAPGDVTALEATLLGTEQKETADG